MAVPRPMLLALLGVLLAGVTFYASRNASQSTEAVQSSAPIDKVEVAGPPPSKPKQLKPTQDAGKPKAHKATPAPSAKKPENTPAKPAPAKPKPAQPAAPRRVPMERALASGKVVVLFIRQPGAADDDATAAAVNSVEGKGVAVFKDTTKHLKKYGPIVAGAQVSQAPAVLIVTKKGARVIEGFIDDDSLGQEVADARR